MNTTPNRLGVKLLTDARPTASTREIPPPMAGMNSEMIGITFIDEIHVRADAITSVLQEFLDLHPANSPDLN